MKYSSLPIVFAVTLTACGDGGSETIGTNDDSELIIPPTNSDELVGLLTTRFDNEQSYDYWRCDNEMEVAYILLPESGRLAEGVQEGIQVSEPGILNGSVRLIWQVISTNSFMLDYPDISVAFDYTDISFSDVDSMRLNGGTQGILECTRGSFGATLNPPESNDNVSPANNEIEGLVAMYGFFKIRPLPTGGVGLAAEAVFAFDDGTYTEDLAGVMADGIAASRISNPQDWGMWRGTEDALELKEWDELDFEETRDSFQVVAGTSDQRLDRCYSRVSGSGSLFEDGLGTVTTSTFCFFENGRFTNDSAVWNQGPLYDATSVDPRTQGQYNITGHVAEFTYDSGVIHRTAFGFTEEDDDPASSIFLNSNPYID